MTPPEGFRQIGWISEAFCESDAHGDAEEAFDDFLTNDFLDVQPIGDYTSETLVHHSHGPVCKVIPVFIPWPSGSDTRGPNQEDTQ